MKKKLFASACIVLVLLTVCSYIISVFTKQNYTIGTCLLYSVTVVCMYGIAAFGIYSAHKKSNRGTIIALSALSFECLMVVALGSVYLKGMFFPASLTVIFLAYYDLFEEVEMTK